MLEIFDFFNDNKNDPSSTTYFYRIIVVFFILLSLLKIISRWLSIYRKKEGGVNGDLEASLLYNVDYSTDFVKRKNSLKFRYLICYVIIKANIWAKSPYLWALYNTFHGFSINEIAILYLVDNLSALLFGPITGNLADIFGRKLFCMGYCVLIITNLSLRLTGSHNLAYIAQILTGISAALVNTTFESWLNFEASKEFRDRLIEKERFLKKLFKLQTIFDAILSIVASIIAAIFYNLYGVTAPVVMAIIVSTIGMFLIYFMWDENKPNSGLKHNFRKSFLLALGELKKREVLSVGLIEGLFQGAFTIFIFAWTPILQLTSPNGLINLGAISICFVIMVLSMTVIYEIFVLQYGINLYTGLTISLLLECICFYAIFLIDSFTLRLVLLSIINGLTGFVNPVNSIIKSQVLSEKYRALLMNIFRMPLNFYVVTVLLLLQYMKPMILCLICAIMIFIAFGISLSMVIWPPKTYVRNLSIGEQINEEVEEMVELEEEQHRY